MEELIDYRLYDPTESIFGKKSDKAEFTKLFCKSKEKCVPYKLGKCATWHGIYTRCPYGRRVKEIGYTSRAKSFNKWIRARREEVEGIEQLSGISKVAEINDYIFFPYPHWSLDRNVPCENRANIFSGGDIFINRSEFTVDFFQAVVTARPQAMMGGEITNYQKNVVPEIVMHVEEELPAFFNNWAAKYQKTAEKFKVKDYIGRKAFLKTLAPGSKINHRNGVLEWDGEILCCKDYSMPFAPVDSAKCIEVRIKPSYKTTVKITDNKQVCSSTKFDG